MPGPALVQAGAQTFHALSPPYVIDFVSNVTAGNTLAVAASSDVTTSAWTASDNLNLAAYTLVPGSKETALSLEWMYLPNSLGGPCEVTVVMTPGTSGGIIYWAEISGIGTAPVLNTSGHGSGTSTTPAASLTTTANGCFVIGACRSAASAAVGSGWTIGGDDSNGDITEYQVQSTAGSISVNFTQTSAAWSVSAIAFEPASPPTLHDVVASSDITTTGWSTAPLFSKTNDSSDATVVTATLA